MTPKTKPNLIDIDPSSFLYLPHRAATVTRDEILFRKNNPSPLVFGIPEIDSRYNPLMPGEVCTILARPGHGKTTLMLALSKLWSALIKQRPKSNKPPLIVYATWEVSVEEFIATWISGESGQTLSMIGQGTVDMDKVDGALFTLQGSNFCVFGQSSHRDDGHLLGAGATLLDLFKAVKHLQIDYDVQGLLIDYLQVIPDLDRQTHSDKKEAVVSDNMGRVKAIAKNLGIPTFIVAQAGRQVDEYSGIKFPLMKDAQWTSSIEQDSNKVFGITRLSDYLPIGQEIEFKQRDGMIAKYIVEEGTLGIKMLKQRFGVRDNQDVWFLNMNWGNGTYILQQPVSVGVATVEF